MQDKPRLNSPVRPAPFSRDPRQARYKLFAYLGFGVLLAVVAGVVVLLPALVARGPDRVDGAVRAASPPPSENRAASPPPSDNRAAQPEAETNVPAARKSAIAEEQLEIALQRQARLENAGVRVWGVERLVTSYAEATRKLVDGDALFRDGEFDRAAAAYRQAASRFEQLAASRPERLGRALNNGAATLDRLDDVAASRQFEIALAVEPGNAIAEAGLKRARNLPSVLQRFEHARRLEAAGELDRARDGYRAVAALDGEFRPARDARSNIERRIAERDFRRAVSDALSALERRDYARSRDALAVAGRLRPGAPEIGEIATRMRQAVQRDRLDELRRLAASHEANEDWAAAILAHGKALGIDGDAGFAVRGKSRAERFLALSRQLDHYLDHPDRLRSPEPAAHARQLIATVAEIEAGPKLVAKSRRLGALIDSASRKRPVILRSDDKTTVVVHRVARFGRFRERRLELRPGTYTAVGSRPGYRDVRVRFSVAPSGEGTVVVEVRCEERI